MDDLGEKASALSKISEQFQKTSRQAKRFQMWQQAKFGMAIGTVVSVGLGIFVAPIVL